MGVGGGTDNLWAVVMAGGRGERLWPLSRAGRGKQFLPLVGKESLLRQTADRIRPLVPGEKTLIVLGREQVEMARAELPEIPSSHFLAEPARCNTAPAVALAAAHLARRDPHAVMIVLPADHVVNEVGEFRRVLRAAAAAAGGRSLVTLGIQPTRPETGYGYVEVGAEVSREEGLPVYRALSFVEKPPRARAEELVAGGRHFWNSGIFIWGVSAIERALARHLPEIHQAFFRSPESASDWGSEELARVYRSISPVSIDYGVMEKERDVLLVPGSFGWNDLGSWQALDDVWVPDEAGNRVRGDFLGVDTREVTVYGGSRLIAMLGVGDLVVVDTPDALLICAKERSQQVRELADRLRHQHRDELL